MAALLRFLPLEGNNIDKTNLATNESTHATNSKSLSMSSQGLQLPKLPIAPKHQAPPEIFTLQRQYTLDVLDLEDKASNLLRTSCTKAQNVAVNKTLQALTAQANRGIMGATVPVA
ncbi:hypothetical protein SNOG_11827 [Parastagonospora nodorum SN15]|uniref:Uncharacterized protein n=1 Tax=Phaeosphaeria nodorum (strain SN15 / ATCC MYA-4574 / FGSC 10173) TaxID=321614 RepID=Q0U8T7_PHANO|nr:hypothetical protein SNOG_11827 [Parastagonospora nodorum SN15]EAT80871.1 hypothetical protein SNOG_11827 [Parastagonospora nodorum SN15]